MTKQSEVQAIEGGLSQEVMNLLINTGRSQAFDFIQKISAVGSLQAIAKIKESKEFKGLPYTAPDGNLRHVGTFQEFCPAFLGRSYAAIAEDLQNLETFGPDVLDAMQRVGVGYRELRQLRKLPEETRLEIQGKVLDTSNKEEIKELIEDLSIDNANMRGEVNDLEKALHNRETRIETLEMKNEQLESKLRDRTRPGPYPEYVAEIRLESSALADKAVQCIDDLERLYAKLENPELDASDKHARSNFGVAASTYYHNLRAIVAKAGRLLALCHEQLGEEINDSLEGLPLLTAEEAKHVLSLRSMMLAEHSAEKISRDNQLKNDYKKPGRRKGTAA